jgi:hypothetical protein
MPRGTLHRRLIAVGQRTKGQIKEMVELIPQALQGHGPVFEGLRRAADEDRVAYAWYWDKADPDDPTLPRDHETRFKRRLA